VSVQRPRVAIVHPWMPHYRVEFFERLRTSLDASGVTLEVAYGSNPPFARDRGDEQGLSWGTRLNDRQFLLGGRSVVHRELWKPALEADLLILEDALRNTDTYRYLLGRSRPHKPTAFWGPGKTMDKTVGRIERGVKVALLKKADWWFSYTEETGNYLSASGIPAERITAVGNTLDTSALSEARNSLTDFEIGTRRTQLGLTAGHTALFMGGLSATKNLDLLVTAGRLVHARDPQFRVLVVGDGPERERLAEVAAEEDFLVMLGPLFSAREKALVAASADLMVMPGLVGLVAVDSFALGLPIVTVEQWPHAPEFAYLRSGENAVIGNTDAKAYAEAIERTLADKDQLQQLTDQCLRDAELYSLDAMVSRFSDGILGALALRA